MKRISTLLLFYCLFLTHSLSAFGFVTNSGNDTVSVIDELTGQIIYTIPVQSDPEAIVLSSNDSTLYVANTGSNSVSVISTTTFQTSDVITGFSSPDSLAADPNGKYLAVGNNGNATLSIVDTSDNSIVATLSLSFNVGLRAMALTPNGDRLYVCDTTGDSVAVVNMTTFTAPFILNTITVGTNPSAVTVTSDGAFTLVANKGSNSVSIIQITNDVVVKTVSVGAAPTSIAINSDNTEAYVTNKDDSSLSVISLDISQAIDVGSEPKAITISPDGTKAYVANSSSNTVSVIDTATFAILATVSVEDEPVAIAVTKNYAYVANQNSNSVSIIDATTYAVTNILVGSYPQDVVATIDYSTVLVTNKHSGTVSFIDTTSNTVTKTIYTNDSTYAEGSSYPTKIVMHPTNNHAYVLNTYSNVIMTVTQPPFVHLMWGTVSLIDTSSQTKTTDIWIGTAPGTLGICGNGDFVYAVNDGLIVWDVIYTAGSTWVIPTTDSPVLPVGGEGIANTVIATPVTGFQPSSIAATSTGSQFAVANQGTNSISVPDNSLSVIDILPNIGVKTTLLLSFDSPSDLAITPDDKRYYVVNQGSNTVTLVWANMKISPSKLESFTEWWTPPSKGPSISVGDYPSNIAIMPNGTLAFVTNTKGGSVTVIDVDALGNGTSSGPLYNTVLPILNDTPVTTTDYKCNGPIVVKPAPTPPVPPTHSTPPVPPSPSDPECECNCAVWVVNLGDETLSVGPPTTPTTSTVLGFSAPSDLAISVVSKSLVYTVFSMETVENIWCKELFANLEWAPFPNVDGYTIYRNGEFLVSLDPSVTSYQDHNLEPNKNYVYTLYLCLTSGTVIFYKFNLVERL